MPEMLNSGLNDFMQRLENLTNHPELNEFDAHFNYSISEFRSLDISVRINNNDSDVLDHLARDGNDRENSLREECASGEDVDINASDYKEDRERGENSLREECASGEDVDINASDYKKDRERGEYSLHEPDERSENPYESENESSEHRERASAQVGHGKRKNKKRAYGDVGHGKRKGKK